MRVWWACVALVALGCGDQSKASFFPGGDGGALAVDGEIGGSRVPGASIDGSEESDAAPTTVVDIPPIASDASAGAADAAAVASDVMSAQDKPAAKLVISPTSIRWDNPGGPREEYALMVANAGTAPAEKIAVIIDGVDAADFKLTANTCVFPLFPAGICTLSVSFAPKIPPPPRRTAAIVVRDADNTARCELSGI